MFETQVGALAGRQLDRLPPPRDRAGDLHQLQERRPARAPQAAVRHRAGRRKTFRNEITPGNFLFRAPRVRADGDGVLRPARRGREWYRYWVDARRSWYLDLGLREENLRVREHAAEERSHYSSGTSDLEYLYPIGWQELEGVANRGDYDLTQHTQESGTKLEWVEQDGTRYTPHVIEPAVSIDRIMLAFLCDAYDEEVVGDRERVVLASTRSSRR